MLIFKPCLHCEQLKLSNADNFIIIRVFRHNFVVLQALLMTDSSMDLKEQQKSLELYVPNTFENSVMK